jgi:hypothetical protein
MYQKSPDNTGQEEKNSEPDGDQSGRLDSGVRRTLKINAGNQ